MMGRSRRTYMRLVLGLLLVAGQILWAAGPSASSACSFGTEVHISPESQTLEVGSRATVLINPLECGSDPVAFTLEVLGSHPASHSLPPSGGSYSYYGDAPGKDVLTARAVYPDAEPSYAQATIDWQGDPQTDLFAPAELAGLRDVFDLPSTASESDVAAAVEEEEALSAVIEAIREALPPGSYAGLYVTHDNGRTRLHVGVVEPNVSQTKSIVNSLMLSSTSVMYFKASRTLAELRVIANSISLDRGGLQMRCGVEIVSVGPNEQFNRVEIGTYPSSSCVEADSDQRYGQGSTDNYQEEPYEYLSRETSYPPMLGGLRIHSHAGQGSSCTTSFVLDSDPAPSSAAVSSAGHCGANGHNWYGNAHGGSEMPLGSQVFDHEGGNLDGAVVTTPNGSAYSKPQIFITSSFRRKVVKVQRYRQATKGQHFCGGGATTGSHCGTITNVDRDLWAGGTKYTKALVGVLERGYIDRGDSGGPIYRPVESHASAVGIISARARNNWQKVFFSHVEFLENRSNYHVRVAGG